MTTGAQDALPPDVVCLGFMQWVHSLAMEQLGTTQYSTSGPQSPITGVSDTWRFARPDGSGFDLSLNADGSQWVVGADAGFDADRIGSIIARAAAAVKNQEFGENICYIAQLASLSPEIGSQLAVQMLRILGDQRPTEGRRRLSNHAILEFCTDREEGKDYLFVPDTRITVYIYAPGPTAGPLSAKFASNILETVRLICSLALGRPVSGPPAIFPAKGGDAELARQLQFDQSILTLARNGVSLDVFAELLALADFSGVDKIRRSLAAYDSAIQQSNPDAAVMLFVSGIEAISAPGPKWGSESAGARFVYAAESLCLEAVDALVNHANVETAFDITLRGKIERRRKRLLYALYDRRSVPTHTGLSMAAGMFDAFGDPRSIRVALVSELHWQMILGYILAPRSFLVGHPEVDPRKATSE
ncbi:hypothetical protein [Nonomuraea sp. NPDC048916]|uniref:hypothetical protein n=1 Tax=Nonomuraea sp. NPDC048916 TaxID=3154232 RepID=UPI0033D50E33